MHNRYAFGLPLAFYDGNGEGGIRTLGSLLGYGALAKRCFQPLSHLTNIGCKNIARNCGLPITDIRRVLAISSGVAKDRLLID